MPTRNENIKQWNEKYDWIQEGDEWSSSWGNSDSLWNYMLFPRIKNHLRVKNILEIAPGYGRITNYLKDYCESLFIVDVSENCITACKNRFKESTNINYYVNDGMSLNMIADNSIDLIISFDSLVHAESNVIENYVKEFSKKLKPGGAGFIHHSNLKSFLAVYRLSLSLIFPINVKGKHWRAKSMSADLFKKYCTSNNLNCHTQELINWGSDFLIDTFSTFTKEEPNNNFNRLLNYDFMKEAEIIKKRYEVYK